MGNFVPVVEPEYPRYLCQLQNHRATFLLKMTRSRIACFCTSPLIENSSVVDEKCPCFWRKIGEPGASFVKKSPVGLNFRFQARHITTSIVLSPILLVFHFLITISWWIVKHAVIFKVDFTWFQQQQWKPLKTIIIKNINPLKYPFSSIVDYFIEYKVCFTLVLDH